MENLLNVKRLTKTFPIAGTDEVVHAVNDVSFSVARGEVLGLVGESGSGKTTVGRCLLRLIEPDDGEINFNGDLISEIPLNEFRPLRSDMQLVFQEPYDSLNPRMTVGEMLREPLDLFRTMPGRDKSQRINEVLQLVRLPVSVKDRYAHQLSGGQQQRVGIARALILNPKLVILDEPTSALDISVRAEIVDLLFRLKEELDLSYIFISHDLTAVKYISDRIAVMYLGQIVETADADEIFSLQYMPYSRALLSSVLYPNPEQERADFSLRGEIPSPIDLPMGCFLESRCPLASVECKEPIELTHIAPGRTARCIRVQREGLEVYGEVEALQTTSA